jgi:transcriptional regulator with XRE-family HTH domain
VCDADKLRVERERRCWTQGDLARAAGLGVRTISRMENGAPVSAKAVHDVAETLEVPFEALLRAAPSARHNLPPQLRRAVRRPDLEARVHDALDPARAAAGGLARVCLLHGQGGMGKTELAAAYAWNHLDAYESVLWVPASRDALEPHLLALAPLVRAEERSHPGQQATAIRQALQRGGPHLLILDDVDDPHLWRRWQLDRSEVRLLLTSRRRLKGPTAVEVAALPVADALAVLGDPADDDLRAIADALGCLTLGLAIARDVLEDGVSPAALRARIDADTVGWTDDIDPHVLSFSRPAQLGSVFASSVDALDGALAPVMLRALAWCAPTGATPGLLEEAAAYAGESGDAGEAIQQLLRLSLVQQTGSGVRVHPVLRQWLRGHDADASWRATRRAIVSLATRARSTTSDAVTLLTHREQLALVVDELGAGADDEVFQVALRHADTSWLLGLYAEAEALYRRILAAEPPGPLALRARTELGQQLVFRHRWAEATPMLEGALEVARREHGDVSEPVVDVLQALGNAATLRARFEDQDYTEATARFRESLAVAESVFGADHVRCCPARFGLGQVHEALGDPAAAAVEFEHCATVAERAYGSPHPETQAARFLAAQAHAVLGRDGAVDRMRAAHRELAALLGEGHPQVVLMAQRLTGR